MAGRKRRRTSRDRRRGRPRVRGKGPSVRRKTPVWPVLLLVLVIGAAALAAWRVFARADYNVVLKEMEESGGATSLKTRFRLAKKVFQVTHQYDGAISQYLEKMEG